MFWRKTTITRPDRDRLVQMMRTKENRIAWGMFINDLRREIDRARVVDPARVSSRVVTMHSKVRFLDVASGGRETYTLVYPEQADLRVGRLSVLSPLGTVLLGAREGDVVGVVGAAGLRGIKVEKILHQPEAVTRAENHERAVVGSR